jgi:amino acid transporter
MSVYVAAADTPVQVFAWIAAATLLPYFTGSQICGLVILNYPDYVYKGWHVTLIGYATVFIPLIFNIFARKTLKAIEIIGAILHTIFFVVFVVVLITLGGRNSAEYVFTANSGGVSGWENPTIQWCIGLLSAVFPLTGKRLLHIAARSLLTYSSAFDGVLHLSAYRPIPTLEIVRPVLIKSNNR